MSEYKSKYKGQQIDNILGNAAQKSDLYKYATKAEVAEIEDKIPTKVSDLPNDKGYLTEHQDISNLATKADLNGKVDKVAGKQLSTEDFTTLLKQKLDGLQNYDDTEVQQAVSKLRTDLDTLVSDNEILEGKIPTKTSELNNDSGFLTEHQDISHLATKEELQEKQDIISDLEDIREGAALGATALQEEQYKGTISSVELGEEVDEPELGYVTKGELSEVEQELSELDSKVNNLDIQLESAEYVNILSNQTIVYNSAGGRGMQYIINQDNVLFQASKADGVGKDEGDYYFVNFQLDSGVFWKKNHQYYCAIDVLANSSVATRVYLDSSPKFDNSHSLGYYITRTPIPTGQRGWVKNFVEVNKEDAVELYPNANKVFVKFWNKIYTNDVFDIKIYNIVLVDLGIPGTEEYRSWEEIDYIFSSGIKEYSVSTARLAHKLKLESIECWGDSLTAQNYGKYIQGANVLTHGFGGKTSTYIRDEFLSNFDKKGTQVIWVGRNNYQETDVVIDDIRDMVSALAHNDFIIMCPPNGYYGKFGTNGEDGTGEMKGGTGHSKFLELEKRLSEEYPSNFLNIRKAVIEGWRMGNVRLLSDFTQPSIGSSVTIEVSDAAYLTTYNSYDLDKFGQDFMSKIRIGINGKYDVYKVVEKVDDTHLIVQLEESNRIAVDSTVGNITDSGGNSAVKYIRVMQNADYMCWLYDTTLSTFRKDGIHMTEDGLKLVAQIVSRKLASMKLL